ncbi:uncharacterized protein LOC132720389 [Ruditapes philippinarum]|uniref:uncharacterized protein LOC132720389 n=1 Tax=Ruditapes philippinarum TaxID=129788 RepID=UPI00295B7CFD|nr:uncharacterized protein LOC132720389 [Ruditapes philippinarum]
MQQLVLHMMNETTVNLCKLCQCLRQLAHVMADLVENSNTDGREIEQYLKEYEEEKVKEILKEHLMERENKSIPTERLHIFVEKRFGVPMAFKKIQMYVSAVFPNVRYTTEDFSFIGLAWRNEIKKGNEEVSDNGTDNVNVSLMTCETFAYFMGNCISKLDERLVGPLSRAIREQTIAPSIFLEMSPDDMKDVFSPYIEHSHDNEETNLKYGFGVKKFLENKKNEIRDHSDIKFTTEAVENLRLFDSPFTRQSYQRLKVQPNLGNLLIPAHEFRCPPTSKIYIEHFVVKEVIKFTAACINGRKNGTIHFGIEHSGNCIGKIKGMQNSKLWHCLDKKIGEAINVCFKEKAYVAFKCVRPAQFIPVEGDGIVIEIDVVPFSKYISKSFLKIFFPPKGNQKQQCYVYSLKPDAGILPVSEHAIQESENFYENVLQERMNLEQFNDNRISTSSLLEKLLRKMLTGGNIFKQNPAVVCKLPHCNGHFIEMTKVERESLEFTDIEIISGEECIDLEAQMTPEDTRRIATENHQHEIEQHPGAGCNTLGVMEAKVRRNQAFTQRVEEARQHLEQDCNQQVDERDLLVYLGDKIITLSNQGPNTHSSVVCSMGEYKRLLSYSTKLVAKQTQAAASKRLYLETFLYYAMLHWPLKTRTMLDVEAMSKPTTYEQLIKKWEESYNNNFYIKTLEQGRRYRPKNYFALGKGSPGNDIIDLESIKREWMDKKKKETGRVRKPVYKDFFWRETFVEERLARLEGFVDDTGNNITHEAEYVKESYKFRIRTYYPCPHLSNRSVTFVLGFTWKEPIAFDVVEFGKEGNSSLGNETLESESAKRHGKKNNGDEESEILYGKTD